MMAGGWPLQEILEDRMIAQYAPGFLFLVLVSSVIALVFAILIPKPAHAILLGVGASTLLLNSWAVIELGEFDVSFLVIVLVVAAISAFPVTVLVNWARQRGRSAA